MSLKRLRVARYGNDAGSTVELFSLILHYTMSQI